MIDVLICDDEPRSVEFISSLIEWEENGFRLAAVANSVKQAMSILAELHIDIVLFDIMMPEATGVDLSRMIRDSFPQVRMVALSSYDDYDYVREVLLNGASDYVLKHRLNGQILLSTLDKLRNSIAASEGVPSLDSKTLSRLMGKGDAEGSLNVVRTFVSSFPEGRPARAEAVSIVAALLSVEMSPEDEVSLLEKGPAIISELEKGETALLEEMIRHIISSSGEKAAYSAPVTAAVRLIGDGYSMNITLEDAAGMAGVSPAYLSRIFHKESGKTFVEYLTQVRLSNAMQMMRNGDNLKKAAFDSGFKEYGYFLKVFKKNLGITPAAYLEQVKIFHQQ